MRGWFAIVLLVCGCLLFGGCGGGDDESGTNGDAGGDLSSQIAEGPAPAKSKYIKEGEELCKKVPQRFQATMRKLEPQLKKEAKKAKKTIYEVRIEKAAVPPLHKAVEEFIALGAPAGDEKEVAKMIEALEAAAVDFEKDPSMQLSGAKSPFVEYSKLTTAYGFKLCPQL